VRWFWTQWQLFCIIFVESYLLNLFVRVRVTLSVMCIVFMIFFCPYCIDRVVLVSIMLLLFSVLIILSFSVMDYPVRRDFLKNACKRMIECICTRKYCYSRHACTCVRGETIIAFTRRKLVYVQNLICIVSCRSMQTTF